MLATAASSLVQLFCPLSCLDELIDRIEVPRSRNNRWAPSPVISYVVQQSLHMLRTNFSQAMESIQPMRSSFCKWEVKANFEDNRDAQGVVLVSSQRDFCIICFICNVSNATHKQLWLLLAVAYLVVIPLTGDSLVGQQFSVPPGQNRMHTLAPTALWHYLC